MKLAKFTALTFILQVLLSLSSVAQDGAVKDDIVAPTMGSTVVSPQNNINPATGKVAFSVPITSVKSKASSYPIAVGYNGANVFNEGQLLNKYSPSGILGVGWGMSIPRIVADTKYTGGRDDDTFYIQGTLNSKLICFNKNEPGQYQTGTAYWEFKTEQHSLAKITYFRYYRDYITGGQYVDYPLDYWEIVDQNGVIHIFGNNDNSRESLLAWGNWIGDSNNPTGAEKHTIVWNIAEIKDQWDDKISFSYEKVERAVSSWGPTHTEAAYLKEVSSDSGEKVVFNYLSKQISEYYEPHTQMSEPDAYQERYESKFLYNIKTYDRANQLVYTHVFTYQLQSYPQNNSKRFLTSITQKDKNNIAMPPHSYEYYHTGDFKGGIKKVTYPQGGFTTYNYEKKYLFTNNNSVDSEPLTPNYTNTAANYVSNNFSLKLQWNGQVIAEGDQPFRVLRDVWNGSKWKRTEKLFNEQISFDLHNNTSRLDNARFVFGDNFYAVLIFKRDTNLGYLYLSHLNPDGVSWSDSKFSAIPVEADTDRSADPVLISGDNFVAIGTNKSGRLHKYTWNGSNWNYHQTQFNQGRFFYGAANNYILVLDRANSSTDFVTGNPNHPDNYYITYLDAEKNWQIKSWSAIMHNLSYVNNINDPSFFYPSNSMSSFVADNNPEFFLRWDTNYYLTNVDNVVGQKDDTWPLVPVGNNMFVLHRLVNFGYIQPKVSYAFNGVSWQQKVTDGRDNGLFINQNLYLINQSPKLDRYNPNTHSWMSTVNLFSPSGRGYTAFGTDLFMGKKNIYKINNNGYTHLGQVSNSPYNDFSTTGGGDYIYSEFSGNEPYGNLDNAIIFYLDKKTGSLQQYQVKNWGNSKIGSYINRRATAFGGNYPFFSRNTYLGSDHNFKRIIDNVIGQQVFDNVVSSIETNNGDGEINKIEISYALPNPDRNNNIAYYGEVTIENRGSGNSSIGKVKDYYNNGASDIRMAGLLDKQEVFNKNNQIVKRLSNTYNLNVNSIFNTQSLLVGQNFNVLNSATLEEHMFDNNTITSNTIYQYNSNSQIISKKVQNSLGHWEEEIVNYAYNDSQYNYLLDKNMLELPSTKISKINNVIVSVKETKWTLNNNKVIIDKMLSGPNINNLRTDFKVDLVDNFGNVLQTNDNHGKTNVIIMGNSNLNKVATITNATYQEVVAELDVTYTNLQNLNNSQLEIELRKLYDRLPNAMISISLYDTRGRIIKTIDNRKLVTNYNYDTFGRLLNVKDEAANILEEHEYNHAGN